MVLVLIFYFEIICKNLTAVLSENYFKEKRSTGNSMPGVKDIIH